MTAPDLFAAAGMAAPTRTGDVAVCADAQCDAPAVVHVHGPIRSGRHDVTRHIGRARACAWHEAAMWRDLRETAGLDPRGPVDVREFADLKVRRTP